MAVQTITIEAISHKFDKFAVMAGDKWYNTKAEFADEWDAKPKVGDTITFDDGGKKYLSRMRITKSAAGAAGSAGKTDYNLGVEVGHASNLAMRVMEMKTSLPSVAGTTDFYKDFIKETETIYKLMKGLKVKLGDAPAPSPVVETSPKKEEKAPVEETEDLSDLF
jgi:hypothetical protein